VQETVGNAIVLDLASLVKPLPAVATYKRLHQLCADDGTADGHLNHDWVLSLAAAEHLPPSCTAAFFQALQRSKTGVRGTLLEARCSERVRDCKIAALN
jgi:hypothetical protein